jgi:DNA-binding NarL/FixJ family response regulator
MELWCRKHVRRDVETIAELDLGLKLCHALRPSLLALDPAVGDASVARAVVAIKNKIASHLLVLDRRPREGVLVEVLADTAVSYLSRMISSDELAAAIRGILDHGSRAIDPALMSRLRRSERGLEFRDVPGHASVANLSARERQVMQLLAQGKSVRQCAAALGLAHSTIDNHKARLMKKLGLHKASQLTCRAIREGLIAP